MSVRIGNKIVAGMPEKALHGIGEIFTTTDTGVVAGAVEANGGSYNLADYDSGTDSIASKLAAGTLSYVSKAEFQTQVTNTGACDSFGWNGAGASYYAWYINEPDGTGYTISTNPVVGDTVYYVSKNYTTTVAGYVTKVGSNETGSYIMWTDSSTVHYRSPNLDKTKEGDPTFLVPNLSETTNLRVMVQLATGATDQALETCTSVLSDVSALNAHKVIDFQAPTASNGYTWYRKYADGWVEQGRYGYVTVRGQQNATITLPVEMADANYVVQITNDFNNASNQYCSQCNGRSTTQIIIKCGGSYSSGDQIRVNWQVSGYAA